MSYLQSLLRHLLSIATAATIALTWTVSAQAETLDSTIADTRTLAAFKVNDAALTKWLPDTHRAAPFGGSFQGANILMMFIDRMLHQSADGSPKGGGAYRMMALIVRGEDKSSGEKATFISRVYSPGDGAGPYKTAVKSAISHSVSLSGTDVSPLSGRHVWRIEQGGGSLEIGFGFVAAVPGRKSGESILSTPVDPGIKRIYRYDQLTDVLLSKPKGIDRTSDLVVSITIPELAEMFDGSEDLIGLADRPFYTRQTFKP